MVDEATIKCRKILTEHLDELHIVAKSLKEYETLTLDEMKDLINGIPPTRDDFNDEAGKKPSVTPSVPKTSSKASPQTS